MTTRSSDDLWCVIHQCDPLDCPVSTGPTICEVWTWGEEQEERAAAMERLVRHSEELGLYEADSRESGQRGHE